MWPSQSVHNLDAFLSSRPTGVHLSAFTFCNQLSTFTGHMWLDEVHLNNLRLQVNWCGTFITSAKSFQNTYISVLLNITCRRGVYTMGCKIWDDCLRAQGTGQGLNLLLEIALAPKIFSWEIHSFRVKLVFPRIPCKIKPTTASTSVFLSTCYLPGTIDYLI